jgi:hypothetical protein
VPSCLAPCPLQAARPLVHLSVRQRAALERWLEARITARHAPLSTEGGKGSYGSLAADGKALHHHHHGTRGTGSDNGGASVLLSGGGGGVGGSVWPSSVHITVSASRAASGVLDAKVEGALGGVSRAGEDI